MPAGAKFDLLALYRTHQQQNDMFEVEVIVWCPFEVDLESLTKPLTAVQPRKGSSRSRTLCVRHYSDHSADREEKRRMSTPAFRREEGIERTR